MIAVAKLGNKTMRSALVIATLALTFTVALTRPSTGRFAMPCIEAYPPHCVDSSSAFGDDTSFSMCRSAVQSYVRKVDQYVECLRDEQKAALKESDDVVRRFNCHAKGNSLTCF